MQQNTYSLTWGISRKDRMRRSFRCVSRGVRRRQGLDRRLDDHPEDSSFM